jgi:hypothetical protein
MAKIFVLKPIKAKTPCDAGGTFALVAVRSH